MKELISKERTCSSHSHSDESTQTQHLRKRSMRLRCICFGLVIIATTSPYKSYRYKYKSFGIFGSNSDALSSLRVSSSSSKETSKFSFLNWTDYVLRVKDRQKPAQRTSNSTELETSTGEHLRLIHTKRGCRISRWVYVGGRHLDRQ